MARKKYIKDYRLIETVDERGRIRSDYEYIGADYRYVLGAEAAGRERKLLLALCGAGIAAFAAALLPNAAGSHALYVTLPFLFTAIPLGIVIDTLLSAMPRTEPLRHQQADMLENRYPPAALWTAICPAASLVGQVVRLLLGGAVGWGDGVFLFCAAVLTAVGAVLFSRRGRVLCREDD